MIYTQSIVPKIFDPNEIEYILDTTSSGKFSDSERKLIVELISTKDIDNIIMAKELFNNIINE